MDFGLSGHFDQAHFVFIYIEAYIVRACLSAGLTLVHLQTGSLNYQMYVGLPAGLKHTCAMNKSDILQCWGTDTIGSLGVGSVSGNVTVPVTVQEF